jgi:hypothetical protein
VSPFTSVKVHDKRSMMLGCRALNLRSSFQDMVRHHAGAVLSFLTTELSNMFPNLERMANVTCPTLIGMFGTLLTRFASQPDGI